MPDEHGNADRGAGDAKVGKVEDLAALRDDLPFFLRIAVVQERVDLRECVERDRVRVDRRFLRCARGVRTDLGLQLRDRVRPGPRDGLVRVDDDALEAGAIPQRHQERDELHRAAVRVGHDPFVGREVVRVDLADDERDPGLHPPRAGVVDHRAAVRDGLRSELARDARAGREERDVDAIERLGRRLHHRDGTARDGDRHPGRAA